MGYMKTKIKLRYSHKRWEYVEEHYVMLYAHAACRCDAKITGTSVYPGLFHMDTSWFYYVLGHLDSRKYDCSYYIIKP